MLVDSYSKGWCVWYVVILPCTLTYWLTCMHPLCLSLFYTEKFTYCIREHMLQIQPRPLKFILQNRIHAKPLHSWIYSSASENLLSWLHQPCSTTFSMIKPSSLSRAAWFQQLCHAHHQPLINVTHSHSCIHGLFLCCTTNTLCVCCPACLHCVSPGPFNQSVGSI